MTDLDKTNIRVALGPHFQKSDEAWASLLEARKAYDTAKDMAFRAKDEELARVLGIVEAELHKVVQAKHVQYMAASDALDKARAEAYARMKRGQ